MLLCGAWQPVHVDGLLPSGQLALHESDNLPHPQIAGSKYTGEAMLAVVEVHLPFTHAFQTQENPANNSEKRNKGREAG